MRLRVGIFGGSFDPPHSGHVAVCRYLLDKGDVDQIWVLPCFKHPFDKGMVSFKDRLTMCRFAFNRLGGKAIVSDIERTLGGTSHTVRIVEYLQNQFHEYKFSLVMGSDVKNEILMWKDSAKVRSMIQFITVPRGDSSPIPDISSTDVRACIKSSRQFADLVPREVAIYIITHGLYT